MSMFQRKAHDDREDQTFEEDTTVPHPASVGHLLRTTREGLGWDLRDVAAALRIRTEYLAALERNTVEGLPGVAYAMGFLRAYADYLGLDGNEVVSRFKSEKKTLAARPELSFPVPLTDRGIPGSGLFLIAGLLIVLAYGTWHYMSSSDHPAPSEVEPVPARLLPPPPQAEAPIPAPPQTADAAKPAAEPAPAPTTPAIAPGVTPVPAPVAVAPAAAPAATAPAPAAPVQPSIGAPQLAAGTPPVPGKPAPGTPVATPPNANGALPAVPPESAAPAADSKDAKVYGSFAEPGRILVKAKGYAWVQVYDGKEVILTRTLHPGDSYYAPNKPGLIMRTGNAGGLAFVVDGKELPALGPTGMVKKKIPLDPQRLLSGDLGEDVPSAPKPAAPSAAKPAAAPVTAAPAAAHPAEDTPE
ncbi:MAG TPA: RodZ domain-containing protein [Aliidongia sp.]|nr:RodZ domain-containing protein [Aliidongia sp.]